MRVTMVTYCMDCSGVVGWALAFDLQKERKFHLYNWLYGIRSLTIYVQHTITYMVDKSPIVLNIRCFGTVFYVP